MDAEAQDVFRKLVAHRSSALLTTAVLPSGGDSPAGEDPLQNALTKAAGRLGRSDEPEAYVRQIRYRRQEYRWQVQWPRRGLRAAEPPQRRAPPRGLVSGISAPPVRDALARPWAKQRAVHVLRRIEAPPEAEVACLDCSAHLPLVARLRTLAPELAAFSAHEAQHPAGAPCRLLAHGRERTRGHLHRANGCLHA